MTVSAALEREVAAIRALDGGDDRRQRHRRDLHFASLLVLLASRIRRLTRRYGLLDHFEDAEQACAIGVMRALELYEPKRARFTTFVNWHLRGELQALRFRLRTDQRDWAKAVGAATLSMEALEDEYGPGMFVDEFALARVEAGAAELMARQAARDLLDDYFAPTDSRAARISVPQRQQRDRAVLEHLLLGREDDPHPVDEKGVPFAGERLRTATRRAVAGLAVHARRNPRFDPDAWAEAA